MLIARYADLLIVHSLEGWALLPNVVLRENLYADPRKPVAVEPGIKVFGNPDESSPVLLTTNFALTYYTVASDLESAAVSCFLIIVDTEGLAVDCAVAGRKLTAEGITDALRKNRIEEKVKHRKLIIPGKAARLSDETQELSRWEVLIGPQDSSGIPSFLQERWKKPREPRSLDSGKNFRRFTKASHSLENEFCSFAAKKLISNFSSL